MKTYLLKGIPDDLHRQAGEKAKAQGTTIRALLIGLLRDWFVGLISTPSDLDHLPTGHRSGQIRRKPKRRVRIRNRKKPTPAMIPDPEPSPELLALGQPLHDGQDPHF